MKSIITTQNEKSIRAVLVALNTEKNDIETNMSLDEAERLLETAGGVTACRVTQNLHKEDPATYIGSGKLAEIAEYIKNDGDIDLCIFDNELSPSQIKNIEKIVDVRVIDRTMLILDIFAQHATTNEGKLQVEIACLRYLSPRLTGKGIQMSRQGGTANSGIGARGPGESKLETDRRHIKRRIDALNEQIAEMEKNRDVQRASRRHGNRPSIAIAGYTNAGKSTLLNYLTGAGILAKDKLFATLDPTIRKLQIPNGDEILLTDTVGFIKNLPTHLIKAFKSTLDELKYSDIVIHLCDASESIDERNRKKEVTEKLIEELGGENKCVIKVCNKFDIVCDADYIEPSAVCVSSVTGEGIDELLKSIQTILDGKKTVRRLFFPHKNTDKASELFNTAKIIEKEYCEDGLFVVADCDEITLGRFRQFIVNN